MSTLYNYLTDHNLSRVEICILAISFANIRVSEVIESDDIPSIILFNFRIKNRYLIVRKCLIENFSRQ